MQVIEDTPLILGSYENISKIQYFNPYFINCSRDIKNYDNYRVSVDDNGEDEIYDYLDNVCKIIDQQLDNTKTVIIFCKFGQQRSPSIVAAYLMYKYSLSLEECVQQIKYYKKDIFPWTIHFEKCLLKWEEKLKKTDYLF